MCLPHEGHDDGGVTKDLSRGMRYITTFRKLPMQLPNAKTKINQIQSGTATIILYYFAYILSYFLNLNELRAVFRKKLQSRLASTADFLSDDSPGYRNATAKSER